MPAITHVDATRPACRPWTPSATSGIYSHQVVAAFQRPAPGCPVVINTSFNVRGEPIVCTPDDAFRCFMATEMDALVLEDLVLLKSEQGGDAP